MRFTFVLTGIVLLIVGLLAYATIPTIHKIPVETSQNIAGPKAVPVEPGFLAETPPENVTIFPDKQNELRINMTLRINITVSLQNGELSTIRFKLYTKDRAQYCLPTDQPTGCLINKTVSNETFIVPVNSSNTYRLAFDNAGSTSPKNVTFSIFLFGNSVQTIVTKDGSFNFVGLGLGAIGFLVAMYGASRKTVIPWE
jgi:hypothetical protein